MIKKKIVRLHWFFSSQLGIDFLRFIRFALAVPSFVKDWWNFKRQFNGKMVITPCLNDKYDEGGVTRSEYFLQDLLVARLINKAQPQKHCDVGSRIDGFVAHVASFREVEVFDVRPITTKIPGIIFRQADFIQPQSETDVFPEGGYCDSLSCLHALEHFGLGRYGDPIDVDGYKKGIANLAALLKLGGTLYLATPIGTPRVEFNANWVFDCKDVIELARKFSLELIHFYIINPHKAEPQKLELSDRILDELRRQPYNLGIFIFKKTIK